MSLFDRLQKGGIRSWLPVNFIIRKNRLIKYIHVLGGRDENYRYSV